MIMIYILCLISVFWWKKLFLWKNVLKYSSEHVLVFPYLYQAVKSSGLMKILWSSICKAFSHFWVLKKRKAVFLWEWFWVSFVCLFGEVLFGCFFFLNKKSHKNDNFCVKTSFRLLSLAIIKYTIQASWNWNSSFIFCIRM